MSIVSYVVAHLIILNSDPDMFPMAGTGYTVLCYHQRVVILGYLVRSSRVDYVSL